MRMRFLILLFPMLGAYALGLPADLNAEIRLATSPQPEKKDKCITIGDKRLCLEDLKKKSGKQGEKPKTEEPATPPADDKSAAPAEPKCPKPNMIEVPGGCQCKPGYEFGGGEGCVKKCGYGMIGTPPNCRCPLGAKLEMTGEFTKGCICEDGTKPEEVDGNYACQNLGPQ
jgi:hypothetical protein